MDFNARPWEIFLHTFATYSPHPAAKIVVWKNIYILYISILWSTMCKNKNSMSWYHFWTLRRISCVQWCIWNLSLLVTVLRITPRYILPIHKYCTVPDPYGFAIPEACFFLIQEPASHVLYLTLPQSYYSLFLELHTVALCLPFPLVLMFPFTGLASHAYAPVLSPDLFLPFTKTLHIQFLRSRWPNSDSTK
jgi:hypothetical protein